MAFTAQVYLSDEGARGLLTLLPLHFIGQVAACMGPTLVNVQIEVALSVP